MLLHEISDRMIPVTIRRRSHPLPRRTRTSRTSRMSSRDRYETSRSAGNNLRRQRSCQYYVLDAEGRHLARNDRTPNRGTNQADPSRSGVRNIEPSGSASLARKRLVDLPIAIGRASPDAEGDLFGDEGRFLQAVRELGRHHIHYAGPRTRRILPERSHCTLVGEPLEPATGRD